MTGIDAMRNGCTAVCQGRSMMRADLPTMANFFADSGYATGGVGKWALGHVEKPEQVDKAAALAALKPLLEDDSVLKVFQNGKYDLNVLAREGSRLHPSTTR